MKFKGAIFDLDGTLVNSLEDIANAMNAVLKKFNYPTHSYEVYQYFVGSGLRNTVSCALPMSNKTEEEIEKCYQLMIDIYSKASTIKTKPYPGIIELLDELKSRNIKLSVFSNKSEALTKEVVDVIFPNYFDSVVGLTTEALKKPNPAKAIEMAKNQGLKSEEIVFVGDSDIDMQTAVNANMLAVGVLWGYRSADDLLSNGAQHLLQTASDLLILL